MKLQSARSRCKAGHEAATLRLALFGLVLMTTLVGLATGARAAPRPFEAIDLGVPGGATSLNDSSQVVGWGDGTDGTTHGFSWTPAGGVVDLGALLPAGSYSFPIAVNATGQVVGTYYTPHIGHAFSWTSADGMSDLGSLGGGSSSATAVNDAGMVIGSSSTTQGWTHAFIWTRASGMLDLGTLGGRVSFAADVNADGQVVGGSETAEGTFHPFLWTRQDGMRDLGTLGGPFAGAAAISDAGQVVGSSGTATGPDHAFSWTPSRGMRDIGALLPADRFSAAAAVNPDGQVVGTSYEFDGTAHAFSWTDAGGIIELGTLGGRSSYAAREGVNGAGQVIGSSELADGSFHAFSWTSEGGMTDLGTLPGFGFSSATAVNAIGQVAGSSGHAVLWTPPRDTTPPTLRMPANLAVDATSPSGAVVTFEATATDDVDPTPIVVCAPPSGSTFEIGDTTVSCTATDASGNTATASFNLHVRGATEQLAALRVQLALLDLPSPGRGALDAMVRSAQARLANGKPHQACASLAAFVNVLDALPERRIGSEDAAGLISAANRIRAVIACG